MKKKSKSQKTMKVHDLKPQAAEPKGGAITPFGGFTGGVRVATGDVTGDGTLGLTDGTKKS